jgi:hypothetical protein
MALYLIVRHRLDKRKPPFENDWFDNDNDRLMAIKTTPEIGELCGDAKKQRHLVYIHRCGCGDPHSRPMICSSAHIAKVTVSDGKTEVQFQGQKTINIRPVVRPVRGQSFYHAPAL